MRCTGQYPEIGAVSVSGALPAVRPITAKIGANNQDAARLTRLFWFREPGSDAIDFPSPVSPRHPCDDGLGRTEICLNTSKVSFHYAKIFVPGKHPTDHLASVAMCREALGSNRLIDDPFDLGLNFICYF